MATKTPKINKIIKLTEFDLLRTTPVAGNMYVCMDSLKMYYDETVNNRVIYSYVGVKTVNDLQYNITPSYGTTYYCWEDNSLWLWMNKWITLWSDSKYPSAYVYEDIPTKYEKQILNDVYNYNEVLDNNGLLKDGSVVIRDRNRIIKGKLYVNDGNDNLVISSYLGGAIRLLPNGKMSTDGELLIGDEGTSFIRSEFSVKDNEAYVDYSDNPDKDDSEYPKDNHKYLIFHEGNLDASAVRAITPEGIYRKLQDASLPSPLELNVSQVSGKTINEISLVGHTHKSTDITDFATASREQASIEVNTVMNSAIGKGVDISYNLTKRQLTVDVKDFTLAFGGGVTGYGTIKDLGDTTINLTVDPNKHTHYDYVETMQYLQTQINNIESIDPTNYYTRTQTDEKVAELAATKVATANKPLLINSDLKLPATATAADKISEKHTVTYTGDITGTLTTDWSSNSIVTLNAKNIISETPVKGKALLVNSNGDLPGNAETSTALNHTITMNLENEVVGRAILDTTKNTFTMRATLVPGDNILQTKDLFNTVAPLDENGMIPTTLIPAGAGGGLTPKGTFNPANGYPTNNPSEGDFYIATGTGTIGGVTYNEGDWCVYIGGSWTKVSMAGGVTSVNNKVGKVTLNSDDVNAISNTLINYTPGDNIPNGMIVRTSAQGEITGAGIERLINPFTVNSDSNSDVEIASTSTNKLTDGTSNLGLRLMLTNTGYSDILDNAAHDIQRNGITLNHRRYLNFGDGFTITENATNNQINITTGGGGSLDKDFIYINMDNSSDVADGVLKLNDLYPSKDEKPFIVCVKKSSIIYQFTIDRDTPNMVSSSTIDIIGNTYYYPQASSLITIRSVIPTLKVTCDENSEAVNITLNLNDTVTGTFIPTNKVQNTMTTFLPTQDWQPATKKYVDDNIGSSASKGYVNTIGDGTTKTFTITHNLGTENVIVQCRTADTLEQVIVSNKIIDSNKVQLMFNTAPATSSITVYIK